MRDADEKIVWGMGEDAGTYGVIQRKRVGNGGTVLEGLNRQGSARQIAVRDRHKTVNLTATVTDSVNEDNIPLVGDKFTVPVNGRPTEFRCLSAELEIPVEDAATLTITGRTLGEHPQPPTVNSFDSLN